MHARRLAQIAGWIACSAEPLIVGEEEQPASRAADYWSASKCRLQRWHAALKMFQHDIEQPCPMHDPWPAIRVVVEEVLLSEILTRVWTATLAEFDRIRGSDELQCVAHSIMIGHLEARNRALRWLLQPRSNGGPIRAQLNRLRRRMERWTDLLLAQVPAPQRSADYGFQRSRVLDFAADRPAKAHLGLQQLLLAALGSSLAREASPFPANPDLNRQVASGVLACFPSNRFDSTGLPKSAWILKMEQVHDDTQLQVERMIQGSDDACLDPSGRPPAGR